MAGVSAVSRLLLDDFVTSASSCYLQPDTMSLKCTCKVAGKIAGTLSDEQTQEEEEGGGCSSD